MLVPFHQVDDDFLQLGDFLVADVKVDNQRHFLFATPQQLGLLKRAKRWYMDGTFKVIMLKLKKKYIFM